MAHGMCSFLFLLHHRFLLLTNIFLPFLTHNTVPVVILTATCPAIAFPTSTPAKIVPQHRVPTQMLPCPIHQALTANVGPPIAWGTSTGRVGTTHRRRIEIKVFTVLRTLITVAYLAPKPTTATKGHKGSALDVRSGNGRTVQGSLPTTTVTPVLLVAMRTLKVQEQRK